MRNRAAIVYQFHRVVSRRISFLKFAFRSGELRKILFNLDSYGGTDPSGVFPFVLKKVAGIMSGP